MCALFLGVCDRLTSVRVLTSDGEVSQTRCMGHACCVDYPDEGGAPQNGATSLHVVAAKDHASVARVLLQEGADTEARDSVSPLGGFPARRE